MNPPDLSQLDSAMTAHLVRLSARVDALTVLALRLAQLQGLDPEKMQAQLPTEARALEENRLARMADSNISGASRSAELLSAWDSPPQTDPPV